MAVIDWVIAAVLVLSVVGAARNGFFIEAFSLAGVVLGLLIASWNFQRLMPWLMHAIHTTAVAEAIAFLAFDQSQYNRMTLPLIMAYKIAHIIAGVCVITIFYLRINPLAHRFG